MADEPQKEILKKPKPTKEEKAAHKAEMRRIKLEKAEEGKRNYVRDHMEREVKYTALTYERASADWEKMCADIKVPELRNEMQAAWQGVNRSLDQKEHLIDRLKRDRQMADDQYRRNVDRHTNIIDYILNLYELFNKVMKSIHDDECYKLITDFHREIRNKERIQDRRKTLYENILHTTNLQTSKILDNKNKEFICDVDELMNKSIEHRYKLRDDIINKMTYIYKVMKEVVAVMMENSASPAREKIYHSLVMKENSAQAEYRIMDMNALKYQRSISILQKKLIEIELNSSQKISDLRYEGAFIEECFWILKNNYDRIISKDKAQMRELAAHTYSTINHLNKVKRFGELILAISTVCRKYQTEKEKILPWPENADELIENSIPYEETMKSLDHISQMELFWYKVSLAESQNIALREEKKVLAKENEMLQNMLRRYCHQQTHNTIMSSLKICPYPTSVFPVQEASHMVQLLKPSDK